MRWPWVSRARFDDLQQSLDHERRAWACTSQGQEIRWRCEQSDRQRVEAKYEALIEKYHALKMAGASVPEPKIVLNPSRNLTEAEQAIEDVVSKFGGSVRLRRRLAKYRADMLGSDGTEDEIAHAIRHWRDPEESEDVA